MNLFTMTQALRDRPWFGYLFGFVAVLLSLAIRLALGDTALKFPFVIFIPPVVLTTFLGGVRPGIAAALFAGLIADLTLIAPAGAVWPLWPDGWLAMGFYGLTISIDIALIQGMITAFQRAGAAEHELRLLNEDLEHRVAERTAALERQEAEREAAEAKLRQLQKMEAIGQLTGGIAHDFNNMLAIIIGNLDIASRRIGRGQIGVERHLEHAQEGARRAATLTQRLLAFSRQSPLSPRVVNLNDCVTSMSDLLRRTIGERIRLETVLAGGLWPTRVDPNELESAVLNLAVNACDAMPDGGELTIETANVYLDERYVSGEPGLTSGQYAMVAVTDVGGGIGPDVLEKVFDPFFTTKAIGKGTGLGLSMVYGFAKRSGGHVRLYSELAHGTTVKIYLPRHLGSVEDPAAPPPATGLPTARSRSETVLVVEDDERVRQTSCDALRELGYSVEAAASGEEALDRFEALGRVDVLFTDIVMGGMTGRQLADALWLKTPGLKVLFTTGYTRNAIVHNCVLDPGVALLPKPFTVQELAVKLRAVLDAPES